MKTKYNVNDVLAYRKNRTIHTGLITEIKASEKIEYVISGFFVYEDEIIGNDPKKIKKEYKKIAKLNYEDSISHINELIKKYGQKLEADRG